MGNTKQYEVVFWKENEEKCLVATKKIYTGTKAGQEDKIERQWCKEHPKCTLIHINYLENNA